MSERGWMAGATRVETAAKGGYGIPDGAMVPDTVVWHCIQGWMSTMRLWASERPVHNQVSYHFVLGLDGEIVHFVPIFTPAWHAGRLDDTTEYPPTWKLWRPLESPNSHTIAVAAEGLSDAGNVWNKAQMAAAGEVQRWIGEETGIRPTKETIVGHREIAPKSRAHDPGPKWSKQAVIDAAQKRLPPPLTLRNAGWASYGKALLRMGGNRLTPLRQDERFEYHEFRRRKR